EVGDGDVPAAAFERGLQRVGRVDALGHDDVPGARQFTDDERRIVFAILDEEHSQRSSHFVSDRCRKVGATRPDEPGTLPRVRAASCNLCWKTRRVSKSNRNLSRIPAIRPCWPSRAVYQARIAADRASSAHYSAEMRAIPT